MQTWESVYYASKTNIPASRSSTDRPLNQHHDVQRTYSTIYSIEVFSNWGVRKLALLSACSIARSLRLPRGRWLLRSVRSSVCSLGSLSSLRSQGLAVGLGYTSLNPPLRSLPLCFSSLSWAVHTLTYTHLSFPWIHHPGLRSQERGWQGLEKPLGR